MTKHAKIQKLITIKMKMKNINMIVHIIKLYVNDTPQIHYINYKKKVHSDKGVTLTYQECKIDMHTHTHTRTRTNTDTDTHSHTQKCQRCGVKGWRREDRKGGAMRTRSLGGADSVGCPLPPADGNRERWHAGPLAGGWTIWWWEVQKGRCPALLSPLLASSFCQGCGVKGWRRGLNGAE